MMKILLVNNTRIPVQLYGGTERVLWALGKNLAARGHEVTFLVKEGSSCPFARVIPYDPARLLAEQIPADIDLVHLHFQCDEELPRPVLTTIHGNSTAPQTFHRNTVFVSGNHAARHGGEVFVYNGLDFDEYGKPDLDNRRMYFHFLGNAAWRVKNVRGAIYLTAKAGERLHVLGGNRVNFKMGLRVTLNPHVRFHGMVGGDGKNVLINGSKGLLFPVLWHEPFGLAIIESLYFGCPVIGTPYGSLPELVLGRDVISAPLSPDEPEACHSEFGCLSQKKSALIEAIQNIGIYDRRRCHEYAVEYFSASRMTDDYLSLYEKVLNGSPLHEHPPATADIPEEKLLPMLP